MPGCQLFRRCSSLEATSLPAPRTLPKADSAARLYDSFRVSICPGKLLSRSRRRKCIYYVRQPLGVFERRACCTLSQQRSTQRKVATLLGGTVASPLMRAALRYGASALACSCSCLRFVGTANEWNASAYVAKLRRR